MKNEESIAVTSPILQLVIPNRNNWTEYGPTTTTAITSGGTLRVLGLYADGLREDGPATAAILAAAPLLQSVNLSMNSLAAHGPATAAALAAAPALRSVDLSNNHLREHGPATAVALAVAPALRSVDLSHNDLGEHGPATAVALLASSTIRSIDMRGASDNQMAVSRIFEEHNERVRAITSTLSDDIEMPSCLVDIIGAYQGEGIVEYHL